MNQPVCHSLLLVALSFAITGCDETKAENHYVLKEVIDVQGTCSEDHIGQPDNYDGQCSVADSGDWEGRHIRVLS
jgi:hypothetical protein